ncbi:MAG TPA: hypothetical protein ENN67_05150 [Firmicutes bacterium]|nr:hypothetical protein [Bacillota bacterium]
MIPVLILRRVDACRSNGYPARVEKSMDAVKIIFGAIVGSIINLTLCRIIPITPDLSDWGGRTFPVSYLVPLLIFAVVSYIGGWVAGAFSPRTGRLAGMLSGIIVAVVAIKMNFQAPIIQPLLNHPAYPIFSDHALLALAVLLVGSHLGGLRIEKNISSPKARDFST